MRARLSLELKVAVLSALAFMLMFVPPIPLFLPAPFLTYEPSDVPAVVGGLMLGPGAGVAVVVVKSLLLLMYRCDPLNIVGTLMNALAGVSLVGTMALYHRKHPSGMIQGLVLGTAVMTLAMAVANYCIFDFFMDLMGINSAVSVSQYVVACCVPFNLAKGVLSGFLGYFIVKRMWDKISGANE